MGNSYSKGGPKCSVEEIIKAFFKDCVIVWHDPNMNNKKNQQYIAQLKKFCEVFTFIEWEKASKFIREAKVACHVITSETNGEPFVKEVVEYDNVCDIYVFCGSKKYHSTWRKDSYKISCVETNIQNVINQIQQNLFEWCKQASSLNLNLPTFAPIFYENEMNHLHCDLRVIPNFINREQAKNDFIALSKALYPDSMKLIASFDKYYKEYNKSQALRWFTQEDSFLAKVTNNCLRIATPDSIQYGRLLLTDIEQAIKDHYKTKSRNYNGLLYKGVYLSERRWLSLKENQDKEIEMHGILSVSKEKNIALNFMKTDPSKKVFITIIVPKGPNEEEQGFAEIEEFSQYPQEKEVLFNVRSRFTVLEIEDGNSQDLPYRHLILLYGAQGFRKFMSEQNPIQKISFSSIENISEKQIVGMSQKVLFVSIKTGISYSKKDLDDDAAPFLCVPMIKKGLKSCMIEISGCLLRNSSQHQTPFYGYKCCNCQAKNQKSYYICTDCGAKEQKWCENCFEKTLTCMEAKHKIILETSPFSFWWEKMYRNEFNHLKLPSDLVQKSGGVFQQAQSDENKKAIEDNLKSLAIQESVDGTSSSVKKEIIIKCSIEEMMKAFFKDYVIVWHDPDANNQENQQLIGQLKKFCDVSTFTEWEKTRDYIRDTQAVCHVITAGRNGELLVKQISENENVCSIYIFCGNKEYHSTWAKNYQKVSSLETDIQNLINQIHQNLLEWYKKVSSLNFSLPAFASIFDDSDKSQMNHLHRYLKVMPNFKSREQAKNDLLNLSKVIYTDPNNQGLIADFEANYNEYNKEKTLRWYTLESFLYKVTNNCLRIATSDSIQYCRLALKDIEQAIKDQYHEKSKNFNGLLYRGAYISEQEWLSLKENQDKEIEMLGFLSVSKVKNVALHFMERNLNKMALITIIVPKGPHEEDQGFAEIEEYSRYPQEKEILFNVRSRFTVLEAEDDYPYSETLKCRHLVLLYGAQGFRKFITEQNPVQDVSTPSMKDILCSHCHVKSLEMPEELFFVSIADPQKQVYYCQRCINYGAGPFLCVPIDDKVDELYAAKVSGCLLLNSIQLQTPFYGYKCCNCQEARQKSYFVCTDCSGKKWCQNCFDDSFKCRETGHHILLETNPFSFWCEKMSASEFNHFKFQNDLIEKRGELFQQANIYFESHEYEKAIEYYSLYIQQNEAKNKDANLALSYNNLAVMYKEQGEYKKMLECLLKSLDTCIDLYGGETHPSIAILYNNIGNVYELQGEHKKALEYYLESLNIRKSVYGDNHPDTAQSYNNVGNGYYNQGEYKKAHEYFLKSLDIRKSVNGENHPDTATSYKNIGSEYQNKGEFKKAIEYFLKALDIEKSIYGDNHPDTATSYNNIGVVYVSQGKYKEALEYFLKSLNIKKSVYGNNHPFVAISYNNIGDIYFKQGDNKKALESHFKSLNIQESVYGGINHPNIAKSYNNIALAYRNQGEHSRALEYHFKSLKIQESVDGGSNHPDTATFYDNIGVTYSNQKEDKKALEYYLKCLAIRKSVYGGDNHPHIANSYNNIGKVYFSQGKYKEALEYFLKSINIFKSIFGDNHPDLATCFSNIAMVYSSQGEYKKALEYNLKSLEMKKSAYGDNHPLVAISYSNIGVLYNTHGEYNSAVEYYLKSVDILKSVYGDNHPLIPTAYHNIAIIYEKQEDHNKALEYYLKSLASMESVDGSGKHPLVASLCDFIGLGYCKQQEFKKAIEYFSKSLDIKKSIYGENHSETMETQELIITFTPFLLTQLIQS